MSARMLTMLFSDIEGSTRLARALGSEWTAVLTQHRQLMRTAIQDAGGQVESTAGDSFFATFPDPAAGATAAAAAQRAMRRHAWPEAIGELRVRMGLHTGRAERTDRHLVGLEVHRGARIAEAANGGQVLVSEAAHPGLDGAFTCEELGAHRLKDFPEPQRLFHLVVDPDRCARDFPALRTLGPAGDVELLEREHHLASLAAEVEALDRGVGGVVLIEGPPGIGKSALMDATTRLAAYRGARVLSSRGTELELGLAFGAVRQLFGMAVARLRPEERERVLAGPAGLCRPVLGLEPAAGQQSGLSDPLYGLFWLVANLAELGPLVLAVDDLHWLDEESARFVTYLAQRMEGVPVLLLATARPAEPGADPAASAALAEFGSVVRPEALTPAAVSDLLDGRPPGAAHRATGGNPLLVVELGRALSAAGRNVPLDEVAPAAIGRAVLTRVARVSEAAIALARAVALSPGPLPLTDAAALAELGAGDAAAAADALVRAEVLRVEGDALGFLHPVMRTAVYEELGAFARSVGHARAVALLKERGAPPEAIAAHLLAGKPEGDAEHVAILRDAADAALTARAPRAAIRYLERALAEPPEPGRARAALRLELGRLQAAVGRPEAAVTLRAALDETTDGPARTQVAVELGKFLIHAGRPDEAVQTLQCARREGDLDPQGQLAIDGLMVQAAWDGSASDVYADVISRLPADLPGETPGERLVLLAVAYDRLCRLEPVSDVAELMLRAAESVDSYDPEQDMSLRLLSVQLQLCGEFGAVQALAEEWLALARESGVESAYGAAQTALGDLAWLRGELRPAEAAYRLGLEAAGTHGYDRQHQLMMLVEVLLMQGRIEEAAATAAELPGSRGGTLAAHFGRVRALVVLARGDAARALPAFDRVDAELRARNSVNPTEQLWRFDHARALMHCDRTGDAIALMERYLTDAQRFGEPLAIGIGHLSLGLLTGDRVQFEQADAVLRPSYYGWWAARAALELGSAMRREHDTVASREYLRYALDYAEREGAAPIADRAREELELAGARPGKGVLSGVEALTPSEERIARLAADGMTNKEIAQHLFLTVKTVESHLASVFRKLDIKSRRALGGVLSVAHPAEARPAERDGPR